MINKRMFLVFFVAIVLLVAGHLYLSFYGRPAHTLIARNALLPMSREDIVGMTIETDSKETIRIIKGRRWTITKPYSAYADNRQIAYLLDAFMLPLVQNSIDVQALSKLRKSRSDFGLDVPRARVVFDDVSGANRTCLLGDLTPNGKGIYVAIEGEEAIYVVDSRIWEGVNRPLNDYRSKSLFANEIHEQPTAFDVRIGQRSFSRFSLKQGVWSCENEAVQLGSRASGSRIERYLRVLSDATVSSFVWPTGASNESPVASASLLAGYGLDAESATTVTLKFPYSIDEQVSFGAPVSSNLVYALVQNGSAIACVSVDLLNQTSSSSFIDRSLYPFDREMITYLNIVDGDVSYTIAKTQPGTWQLVSPIAAPANNSVVDSLLSRLISLEIPVGEDKGEPVIGVTLKTGKGAEPAIHIPRSKLLTDVSLDDLRSCEILSFEPSEVVRLVVSRAGTSEVSTAVYNSERRDWSMKPALEGTRVDMQAIAAILAELHPLKAVRIEKLKVSPNDLKAYGLEHPRASLGIDVKSPGVLRRNILIGNEVEDGVYATVGSADAIFVLPTRTVRAFLAPLTKVQER